MNVLEVRMKHLVNLRSLMPQYEGRIAFHVNHKHGTAENVVPCTVYNNTCVFYVFLILHPFPLYLASKKFNLQLKKMRIQKIYYQQFYK